MQILIVDDHRLVVASLRSLLEKRFPTAQISEAYTTVDALKFFQSGPLLDVLLCDLQLAGRLEGFLILREALKQLPNLKAIALSMHTEKSFVMKALESGAHGYVVKADPPEEIFRSIQTVLEGRKYLSASVMRDEEEGKGGLVGVEGDPILTSREQEVARQIASGKTSRQIAGSLNLSVRTVEVHRRNLMAKLGVHNIAQLLLRLPPALPAIDETT